MCSRFRAEYAATPFDDVQIQLEDATLVEDRLEHYSNDRLLTLAQVAARRRQEQVLGELLRDRRTAGHHLAMRQVLFARETDAVPVEPVVLEEFGVFRRDDRAL